MTTPKTEITETRTGTATFLKEIKGKHGMIKHWQIDDGTYVLTSSAHHYLAPSSAMNDNADWAWLGRVFSGQMVHDDPDLVSETVVFDADENGKFTDLRGVAKIFAPESHEQALKLAGYEIAGAA